MSKIIVSWSIANDYIMKMDDEFSKHILPEYVDHLSVGFLMPELEKHVGWTAFNIAYSLWLLWMKDDTIMLWAVWKDFEIQKKFEKFINYDYILKDKNNFTACAYVLNDNKWNQITAFHPWAMTNARNQSVKEVNSWRYLLASPNAPDAMLKHAQEWYEIGLDVFFDPGQNLPAFSKDQLLSVTKYSKYLILNEYELNMFEQKTELSQDELVKLFDKIIVTLGEKGTKLLSADEEQTISGAKIDEAIDATGAGDTFRSGLLTGLYKGKSFEESIKLGNIVASFVVETYGTSAHYFNINDVKKRYTQTYNQELFL